MIKLQNRKMPTVHTAYGYLLLSCFLTLLFGLQPTAMLAGFLAISFGAAGVLSIPRITYPKVLLLLLAVGTVPATGVYLLTHSPYFCLATFSIVPATALLVLTIRKRHSRSAGILLATIALSSFLLAAILWWLYESQGSLTLQLFTDYYHKDAKLFIEHMMPLLDTENSALLMSTTNPIEDLSELHKQFFFLIPSLFILVIWVGVWLSTVVIRWIFMGYVYGADRFANWTVTAKRPFAWIYISAFLLAFLMAVLSEHPVFYIISMVFNNVYVILLPTFLIIGCRTIKERMLRVPGCGCMTFMMILTCLFAFSMLPTLLAFTGAFRTLSPEKYILRSFTHNTSSKPSDSSDDSDNPPDQGGNDS